MLMVLTVSGTPLTVIDVEDCMGFQVNLLDSVLSYLPEEGSALEHSLCRATQPNQSPASHFCVQAQCFKGMHFHYKYTSVVGGP